MQEQCRCTNRLDLLSWIQKLSDVHNRLFMDDSSWQSRYDSTETFLHICRGIVGASVPIFCCDASPKREYAASVSQRKQKQFCP